MPNFGDQREIAFPSTIHCITHKKQPTPRCPSALCRRFVALVHVATADLLGGKSAVTGARREANRSQVVHLGRIFAKVWRRFSALLWHASPTQDTRSAFRAGSDAMSAMGRSDGWIRQFYRPHGVEERPLAYTRCVVVRTVVRGSFGWHRTAHWIGTRSIGGVSQ